MQLMKKSNCYCKVNSELAKVQQQINTEHTSQGVNSVKANAMTAIEQITAQAIEKETARDAVKQKLMNKLMLSIITITQQRKRK